MKVLIEVSYRVLDGDEIQAFRTVLEMKKSKFRKILLKDMENYNSNTMASWAMKKLRKDHPSGCIGIHSLTQVFS